MEPQNAIATKHKAELATLDPAIISSLVIEGDLAKLSEHQKVAYYNYRCEQAGLSPAAKPFDLLRLNGKQILYANATCTQQLTSIQKLSHQITDKRFDMGLFITNCRVTGPDGRSTENMAAVSVEGLKGDALANAIMKCCTKAIRRTVLAHCGLGMLDESEADTILGAEGQKWQSQPVQTVDAEEVPTIEQWQREIDACNDEAALGALYRQNRQTVDATPEILALFSARKSQLQPAA